MMQIKAWHAMGLMVRKLWACMSYLRILLVNEFAQLLSQMLLLIICDSTAQQSDILKGACDGLQQRVSVQKEGSKLTPGLLEVSSVC